MQLCCELFIECKQALACFRAFEGTFISWNHTLHNSSLMIIDCTWKWNALAMQSASISTETGIDWLRTNYSAYFDFSFIEQEDEVNWIHHMYIWFSGLCEGHVSYQHLTIWKHWGRGNVPNTMWDNSTIGWMKYAHITSRVCLVMMSWKWSKIRFEFWWQINFSNFF